MAEILMAEITKCFYRIRGTNHIMAFYATGQGIEVAPFGSIKSGLNKGWKTPFFYVRTKDGFDLVKGGSFISAWFIFPYSGVNPFILNDAYAEIYNAIPTTQQDTAKAKSYINSIASHRTYVEKIPTEPPAGDVQIVEPRMYNKKMWQAMEKENFNEAIQWAQAVLTDSSWMMLALRDNKQKDKECGGIIAYPWGTTYPENKNLVHTAILRYPLLNEVGLAMWGMATANYELGNYAQTKYWMKRIINNVPLHQIADTLEEHGKGKTELIIGYWNALVSWEDNPSNNNSDEKMNQLYRQVLNELHISSAKPRLINLPPKN